MVKKNGNLRICIDPRPLNKALKREHFQLPTLDDLLPELADSKVFSTLDLRDGFWQGKIRWSQQLLDDILLHHLVGFGGKSYHLGLLQLWRYSKRLFFNNVSDLEGVINKADDLLVIGKGAQIEKDWQCAQIEKEQLAVVYACERFQSIERLVEQITVLTDHRPLEAIMKKELGKCPKRLQNMLMRLQAYVATVLYHPGKKIVPCRHTIKGTHPWSEPGMGGRWRWCQGSWIYSCNREKAARTALRHEGRQKHASSCCK